MLRRILYRFGMLDRVRRRYLGFGAALFLIFSILVTGIFVSRIRSLSETYAEYTRNEIINIKKDFLKDTVNNAISAVEKIRNGHEKDLEDKILRMIGYLNVYPDLQLERVINYISQENNSEMLNITVEDENGQVVFSIPQGLPPSQELLLEEVYEHTQDYRFGQYRITFMIPRDAVKKQVEEELRQKIYREIYFQDAYMWVNEVLDYNGGEGYGIRLIHPNLKDTEGMILSTEMEDVAGNLPYLEELEGIKKDGELYFTYNFKKLDDDQIGEKITYAKLYEDYNWILAMGIYYDTINEYYESAKEASEDEIRTSVAILAGLGFFIIIFAFIILLILEEKYFSKSNYELKEELATDQLTAAKSRRAGMLRLKDNFMKFKDTGSDYAILMLDLDDFKLINDNFGHEAGDRVLIEVVRNIKASIRDKDAIYRWGGEEFIILIEGTNPERLQLVIEKVLEAVERVLVTVEENLVGITTSIGATYFREDDTSFDDAIRRADQALYESKKNGKGMGTIRL